MLLAMHNLMFATDRCVTSCQLLVLSYLSKISLKRLGFCFLIIYLCQYKWLNSYKMKIACCNNNKNNNDNLESGNLIQIHKFCNF